MSNDAPELSVYMRNVWERQGKMRCTHCGQPVYWDNTGSNASGYCIHAGHNNVDGKNGLYCSPDGWTATGSRSKATAPRLARLASGRS